jgi:hypothetical protein
MTFTHKLSKRLAVSYVGVVAVFAACAGRRATGPVIAELEAVAIIVQPQTVALTPGDEITLTPYAMLPAGDSLPIPVDWSATGGTISADGTYQADSTGDQLVIATARAQPGLVDTAFIQVVADSGVSN